MDGVGESVRGALDAAVLGRWNEIRECECGVLAVLAVLAVLGRDDDAEGG